MFFHVDESGHTGANLFDEAQPMLYYGLLSSRVNVDILAEPLLSALRKKLGVTRLHAAELGNAGLANIAQDVCGIQKKLDIRFDLYRVAKPDHAIICFFDQVFDQGMNPAVTWTGYWTPIRYVLLLKVASLFDEDLARRAWSARICTNSTIAEPELQALCHILLERVNRLPDARSRQLVGDALAWAAQNPAEISYNAADKSAVLQITPNVIGFQSVMHGIATRLKKAGRQASRIVVDQQSQFNKAQRTLAEFYATARNGGGWVSGPGMPTPDFSNMPEIPIEFAASTESAGLELVDLHLWVFKRVIEKKELASELHSVVRSQVHRGRTDEMSLNAIAHRWTKYFDQIPQLEKMPAEQVAKGKEILRIDEERRLKAIRGEKK